MRRRVSSPGASPSALALGAPVGSPLHQFILGSVTLTGFNAAELWGTGLVRTYFDLLPSIVGEAMFGNFLTRWRYTYLRGEGDEELLEELVTTQIFEDPDFGPIARNLVALWYTGMWNQLPAEWRNRNGASAQDITFIVSPQSYTEGLAWKAIHAHPPAAKPTGFGSWALPPPGPEGKP